MICSKCGNNMSDDSDFCMNCGNKVQKLKEEQFQIKTNQISCKKCGKELQPTTVYCPNCGVKQLKLNTKRISELVAVFVVIIFIIGGVNIHKRNLKSPIEGVSKKVYSQGMEYLDSMESVSVKKVTMEYISKNMDREIDDIYLNVDGVDFQIDLGKKPTEEEVYFAKLIDTFWKSWTICYGHESIIFEYKDSEESAVQMASTMYKGLVSEFEDGIFEAKDIIKKANSYSDMEFANDVLENIWKEANE